MAETSIIGQLVFFINHIIISELLSYDDFYLLVNCILPLFVSTTTCDGRQVFSACEDKITDIFWTFSCPRPENGT